MSSISRPISIDAQFRKTYGPRADFAHVSLKFEPANEFIYLDEANWPEESDKCKEAVLEGLIDGLVSPISDKWYLNIKITLLEVRFHHIDSNPKAFYKAARNAIDKLVHEHKNEYVIFN